MVSILEKRDRLISILRSSLGAVDGVGAKTITWTTLMQLKARIVPVSGAESLKLDRVTSTEISRFFTLYRDGITVKDRISYQNKIWNIRNIRELGRREGLEITAEVTK